MLYLPKNDYYEFCKITMGCLSKVNCIIGLFVYFSEQGFKTKYPHHKDSEKIQTTDFQPMPASFSIVDAMTSLCQCMPGRALHHLCVRNILLCNAVLTCKINTNNDWLQNCNWDFVLTPLYWHVTCIQCTINYILNTSQRVLGEISLITKQ